MNMEMVLRIVSCILWAAVLGIWCYMFVKSKKEWREVSEEISTIFHSMPTYSDGDFDIGTLLVFNDKKYVIEEIVTIDGEEGVLNIKCSEKKPLGRQYKEEAND